MKDNDLHMKLNPAVKVFLINWVLNGTEQNIFQERHRELELELRFNSKSLTFVTNISWENYVLTSALAIKTARRQMFLNSMLLVKIARISVLFPSMKKVN